MTLTVIVVTLISCVDFTVALLAVVATTLLVSCGRRSTWCVSDGRRCPGVLAVHGNAQCRHKLLLVLRCVFMPPSGQNVRQRHYVLWLSIH